MRRDPASARDRDLISGPLPLAPASVGHRLLWHRVEVRSDDREVLDLVALMSPTAEQDDLGPEHVLGLDVERCPGGYVVRAGTVELGVAESLRQAADLVFGCIHRSAFEEAAARGWARVHGLVAEKGGQRVVAVGPSGVGKTTLALALLADGWDVHGDESFVTAGGRCLAVPRRFQVKPGTTDAAPEAGRWIEEGDRIEHLPGIRLVDPTTAGLRWRSTMGGVDHLVALERTDGPSRLDRLSTPDALATIQAELFVTVDRPSALAQALVDLVCRAQLHRATVGPDRRTAELLGTLVRS